MGLARSSQVRADIEFVLSTLCAQRCTDSQNGPRLSSGGGRENLPIRYLWRPRVIVPRWVIKEASLTREHVNDIADLGEFISQKVILALPRRKNRSSALSLAAFQHAHPANAPS